MIRPSREEFRKLAKGGRRVPVMREILADTETPVSAFLKIADTEYAFLLESVESGEKWSRYSILGPDPTALYVAQGGSEWLESGGKKRNVRTLDVGPGSADPGSPVRLTWDGRTDGGDDAGSGVFFAALDHEGGRATRRIVRLKG